MSAKGKPVQTDLEDTKQPEAQPAPEAEATVSTEGKRNRKAFMMKGFLPNKDWINVNVVGKGEGTKVIIGRVFGVAFGFDTKVHTFPDGKTSESVVLKGAFETENYMTGELDSAVQVYLPSSYSEKVAAAFKTMPDLKAVEVDCDIGLEATGKAIPYTWVVVAYREGKEMAILNRIKSGRKRPDNAIALQAPAAQKQLTAG